MAMTENRPLIGLSADFENRVIGPSEAEYVLRENYCEAIIAAGGLPVIMPYDPALAEKFIQAVDGIIVTGGMFDIDPNYYGDTPDCPLVTKQNRTEFEFALLEAAMKANLPMLGICNGMQLLGVKFGGKLVQDIVRDVEDGIDHLPKNPPLHATHSIGFCEGTKLREIAGCAHTSVNSLHHQALCTASDYIVAATCVTDGVVEALEVPRQRFCIGLQWQPEYQTSPVDMKILTSFIDAARSSASI